MKLISVGDKVINLEKVTIVDPGLGVIYLQDGNKVDVNSDELEKFVREYNYYDTDEVSRLLKKVAKAVVANPEYMTQEEIKNQLTLKVRYHGLEKDLKDLTDGKKLKELSVNELIKVYKEIMEIIKKIDEDSPF